MTLQLLPEEQEAFEVLENMGLEVNPIETNESKTAEFFVDGDNRGYVIEVKSRSDSEQWKKDINSGEVAYVSRPTGYDRWAEDVSRYAIKQFKSVDSGHSRWWVTWLVAEVSSSNQVMFKQTVSSLFGVRQIVDLATSNMWNCVNAVPGVYERHTEIVGTVVIRSGSLTLCVNENAKDYQTFKNSVLYKSFKRLGPVNSASYLTESLKFLKVDINTVDRKDEKAVTDYISKQYGIEQPILINMKSHTAATRV